MWTYQLMKDELIVGEHRVDGTWLLIYIYMYCVTSKMLLHPVPS